MESFTIRPAEPGDLARINQIYNHYIATSHATFDLEPWSEDARAEWFKHFATTGRHRLFVADASDRALGYAYSGTYRPRKAYETSVETSVYCDPESTGMGLGRALYAALFDSLKGEDVHRAFAGIALPNDASIALHERFGFKQAGLYSEQGRKFGRYWDVAWFERPIP